jgi:OOP family OmpA-OmpF porin
MKQHLHPLGRALALSAALTVTPLAWSQGTAANPVLKGAQVTEDALVDALAIEAPEVTGGVTRGFRPAARPGEAAPKAPKPGAGKASLLITFGTDSADIGGETQTVLDTLARALQSDSLAGFSFKVEGHADARGEPEHNQRLSQQRAEAVAAYLVDKHGILPERLSAIGKGASEPLNKQRSDAPENRRVTIVTTRN